MRRPSLLPLLLALFLPLSPPALAQWPVAQRHMIAASHPLAAEAGPAMLPEGGGVIAPPLPPPAGVTPVAAQADRLRRDPGARALFLLPDGQPVPEGHRLRNPALAAVLRAVAEGGADALHSGPVAADIAAAVRGSGNPGLMTADDLAGYAPVLREALCGPYRAVLVCGFPPPSSGGVTI